MRRVAVPTRTLAAVELVYPASNARAFSEALDAGAALDDQPSQRRRQLSAEEVVGRAARPR